MARWLLRRERSGESALIDPDLFRHPNFTGQMLVAGKAREPTFGHHHQGRVPAVEPRYRGDHPARAAVDSGWWLVIPVVVTGAGPGLLVSHLTDNSAVIPPSAKQQISAALEDDAEVMSNSQLAEQITGQPAAVEAEVAGSSTPCGWSDCLTSSPPNRTDTRRRTRRQRVAREDLSR